MSKKHNLASPLSVWDPTQTVFRYYKNHPFNNLCNSTCAFEKYQKYENSGQALFLKATHLSGKKSAPRVFNFFVEKSLRHQTPSYMERVPKAFS